MKHYSKKNNLKSTSKIFIFLLFIICSTNAFAQPTANAGIDQTICLGSSTSIGGSPTATGGTPGYTYSWSPTIGLSSATVSNPVASPSVTTTYTVTVYDALAFTGIDVVTVTVNSLPNAVATSSISTCDGGVISLFGANAAGATYSWVGPNAYSSSVQNPVITPVTLLATGTYTLTVTAMGCSNTDTTFATVNPTPSSTMGSVVNVTCNGLSDGSATVSPTGGTAPYLYFWDDALNQTTATATGLAAGNYIAYVSDANGCNTQSSVTITQPPAMNVNLFSPTICLGDSATLNPTVTGGVPPYTYIWDEGGTYYYTPSITLSPSTGTSFTLTITDANGCYSNANPSITVNSLTDIGGYIGYSAGSFNNGGTIVLYKYEPLFVSFDTIQTTLIDGSGLYYFNSVPANNYIIKAFPFGSFPDVVPTYLGDTYLWENATILNHGCVSNNIGNNIQMLEPPLLSGPGVLSGVISEGPGFQRLEGDPIPGIDIKLGRNPGGQLVTNTQTNAAGQFTFNNIPVNIPGEYYTIYVDMPGLMRDSVYNITVDATNYIFTQLDHKVDSNSVYPIYPVVTSISNTDLVKENKFIVYPNPFRDDVTVTYSLHENAEVKLEIYNLLGVKEQSIVNTKQLPGDYKFTLDNDLNSGVYFISLTINGKTSSQRIIKTK